jgi:predicted dehydrogenase
MLQVGIAGIGFMGMIHFLAYQRVPGVRVAAICSRDSRKRAGDWRSIKGNFGPVGRKMDLAGIRGFDKFDSMLADAQLDLVDICLPTRLHSAASIAALQSGKHVLCEKPIALTVRDGKAMVNAAAEARRQLLVAHVVPFFPEYAFALSAARTGKYGKLLGGHFRRVIADPHWIADYFDPHIIGGPLVDLSVHDAHFIRLMFGMPRAVFSRGRMRGKAVEYAESQFVYGASSHVVSTACGVIRQSGRSFHQSFEIHFERAALVYDYAVVDGKPRRAMPLTVLDAKGKAVRPKLGSPDPTDGFVDELKEVAHSIASGNPSAILDGQLASDALTICQKQAQSVATGRLAQFPSKAS